MTGIEIAVYSLIGLCISVYVIAPFIGWVIEKIVMHCEKREDTFNRYLSIGLAFILIMGFTGLIVYNGYLGILFFIN